MDADGMVGDGRHREQAYGISVCTEFMFMRMEVDYLYSVGGVFGSGCVMGAK